MRSVAPEDPIVATFTRGHLLRSEVEGEIRSLPPRLKLASEFSLRILVASIVGRRALASVERLDGLAPNAPAGPLQERMLVRALLRQEGLSRPKNQEEAREHNKRFTGLLQKAVGSLQIHGPALAQIRVDESAPVERPGPEELRPGADAERFWLDTEAGQDCEGVIHADEGWYSGLCRSGEDLPRTLLPDDVLYLESTYGPVEGFLHRFTHDATRPPVIVLSAGTSWSYKAAPPPFEEEAASGSELRTREIEVSGTVTRADALAALNGVASPFLHCQAYYRWNNRSRERKGVVHVSLSVKDGRVGGGVVDPVGFTGPASPWTTFRTGGFNPTDCIASFRTYPLKGTGEVRYTLELDFPETPETRSH